MDFAMARSTHSVQSRGRRLGHLALPRSFLDHSGLPGMLPLSGAKRWKKLWVFWLGAKLLVLSETFLDWEYPLSLMPGEG